MIYCGNYEVEVIRVHPEDNINESHYISLTTDKDSPSFSVHCCCDDEWEWTFWYSKTNYEMIKHLIFDVIFECETIDDVIDTLDEIFSEDFEEIVFYEEEYYDDISNYS